MKKYITAFLVVSMSICLIILLEENQKNKEMLDKIQPTQKYLDSIVDENYIITIELSRYQNIIERAASEMNPDCKSKLDSLFNETE